MSNPEAAPAASDALVVSLYPEAYGGSSPGAQDLVGVNSNDGDHSPDVLIRDIPATHHGGTIGSTQPVAPGPGVVSGTAGSVAEPVSDTSSTVLINGQPCVRHGSCYKMNSGNVVGTMTYHVGGPNNLGPDATSPEETNPDLEQMTEIERYLADPDGYVAPPGAMRPMTARLSPELAASLGVDTSPPSLADQMRAGQEAWDRKMMTHSAPVPVERGAGYQVLGAARGVGRGLWGLVEDAAALSQYATDTVLAPVGEVADYFYGDEPVPQWLPSAQRGRDTSQAVVDTAVAVVNDPIGALDAMTREVRDLWAAGEYGEAIGLGGVMVGEMFVGSKGLTRARNLADMPPEAVEALRREGLIDDADIAEADALRRAEPEDPSRRGEDGVQIEGDRADVEDPDDVDAPTLRPYEAILKDLPPEVRAMVDRVPFLQEQLNTIGSGSDRWTIRKGEPGSGSWADPGAREIVIAGGRSPADMMGTLAHEVGHVVNPNKPSLRSAYAPGTTRQQFIDNYVNQTLMDEGFAELNALRARHGLMPHGVDVGANRPFSHDVYNRVVERTLSPSDAQRELGNIIGGLRTSNTGELYTDYYARRPAEYWDNTVQPWLDGN